MTPEQAQAAKQHSFELMLVGWVSYGEAHLQHVADDAPLCAALPSMPWLRAGRDLLDMYRTKEVESTDLAQILITQCERICESLSGFMPDRVRTR